MAADALKPRKRNRRRKRRHASSSSSSPSPSSSSSEDERTEVPAPQSNFQVEEEALDDDSDTTSSSSSSSSDVHPSNFTSKTHEKSRQRAVSRSPSPPDGAIPPLIPANPATDAEKEKEKALREKFRKFWMASIADEFKDDLEEIRKESNVSKSRLALLVDSLASGADVFSASSSSDGNAINEMEIVLEST